MISPQRANNVSLGLRPHRGDHFSAYGLGPLDHDLADTSGGGVDQGDLTGLQGIAAAKEEFRRHAFQHGGRCGAPGRAIV